MRWSLTARTPRLNDSDSCDKRRAAPVRRRRDAVATGHALLSAYRSDQRSADISTRLQPTRREAWTVALRSQKPEFVGCHVGSPVPVEPIGRWQPDTTNTRREQNRSSPIPVTLRRCPRSRRGDRLTTWGVRGTTKYQTRLGRQRGHCGLSRVTATPAADERVVVCSARGDGRRVVRPPGTSKIHAPEREKMVAAREPAILALLDLSGSAPGGS